MQILALLFILLLAPQSPSLDTAWVWREVYKPVNGSQTEHPHSEVLIKADGRWKEIRFTDAGNNLTFGTGNGIFSHSPGDRVVFRETDFAPLPDYRSFITDEAEKRKDTMLGHDAIVYRINQPDGWREVWTIPALGRQRPTRMMQSAPKGLYILEAVSIERREISEAEIALPNLPITRRASQFTKPKDQQK